MWKWWIGHFPSCPKPLFQSEANQSAHFHKKCFVLSLVLKVRVSGNWNWGFRVGFICPMGLLWICYHFFHKPAVCQAFLRGEKTGDLILPYLRGHFAILRCSLFPQKRLTLRLFFYCLLQHCAGKWVKFCPPKHSPTVQRDTTMTLSHMQPLGQVQIKWLSLPQLHLIIKPLGLVP